MAVNVARLVLERARLRPASPAIITHDAVITYGRLGVAVGVVARHLREKGVTEGQVVGVTMGQNPRHIIALLALAQIGAVSLPMHASTPEDRRLLAAKRFGASCVISARDDVAVRGLPFISLAQVAFDGSSIPPDSDICKVNADSPFRIAISSGTSGDPKGMMFTHQLTLSRVSRQESDFSSQSRVLPMDLNFNVGFLPALCSLAKGGSVVLPPVLSPDRLVQAIVSHHVTYIFLSPMQAHDIADQYAVDGIHCPSLQHLIIAGGHASPQLLHTVRSKISPNVRVHYGSTESGIVTTTTPETLQRHPDSVGLPQAWATIEVVDTEERLLPTGEKGLLRIRSEEQVSGYSGSDELTRKHFRDGWFYPGDLGHFDAEGLLYIKGRADEQLNVGGFKINPEEVDAVMVAHPGVVEAGTFVFIDEDGAERVAAAVVLRAEAKLNDIRSHARTRLGPLAPVKYFVMQALPRTVTGKLRRGELTSQFSRSAEA